eukprot:Nitzschia sp. Nitz4//scaffold107_size73032//62309//62971//NITZ4_005771-RA/size73032-processed-gene-0.114-mRNA-1//1//CDS//3329532626//5347//frame0
MMEQAPSTFSALIAGTVGALAVALTVRAMKRKSSPKIHCNLKCNCGKVKGYIEAKREDSMRLFCYCEDCRNFAKFVAKEGNKPDKYSGENGETALVQVCKSDIEITEGIEQLQLSRKGPNETASMHRYYAKCCFTPIMNTVDFLGFTGVFADNLDEDQKKFQGPVSLFPQKALHEKPKDPEMFMPGLLWNLVRYHSSRNRGPFNYDMEPTYWGEEVLKQE